MSDYGRISKSIVKAIADALRFCNGNEAQYTPGQMPNAVRLLKKRLTQKTITQNGTYIPPSNYDGFDRVMVDVSGGPIYYGKSAPLSSLGNNEDLYIQYQIMTSAFDHTYGIVAEFRKVDGVWVQYEKPELPTSGVHIWTKSTGGYDAAMYVQNGYWDVYNNVFVATGEVESVLYNTVNNWNTAKNCNDIALLAYPNGWQVKASTTITDGTNTYQSDAIAKQWGYRTAVDFYIWKPVS